MSLLYAQIAEMSICFWVDNIILSTNFCISNTFLPMNFCNSNTFLSTNFEMKLLFACRRSVYPKFFSRTHFWKISEVFASENAPVKTPMKTITFLFLKVSSAFSKVAGSVAEPLRRPDLKAFSIFFAPASRNFKNPLVEIAFL